MACVFCEIIAGRRDASRVHEDERLVAFLDIRPLRPGHLLVVPRAHRARLEELADGEGAALFETGARLAAAVRRAVPRCAGVNLLLNDGAAANQTVPHVHLHVIPRTGRDLLRTVASLVNRRSVERERLEEQARAIREAVRGGGDVACRLR